MRLLQVELVAPESRLTPMRINTETFLALTVLLGTGVAVGVGVSKLRDRDEPADAATEPAVEAPVTAPEVTKPATVIEPAVVAPVVVPNDAPIYSPVPELEPPMPADLEPEDTSNIPGPTDEG